jgi:hypothetical protein
MIFLDVLLSLNLVVLGVWAVRSSRRNRPSLDQLLAAGVLERAPVEERGGVVVAFPSPEELERRRARARHPSMYGVPLGQGTGDGRLRWRP